MPTTTPTEEQFNNFIEFRQAAYQCLGKARDAQFELTDAVLVTPTAQSFVELALAPIFRRRWSSVYEALQDGTPDRLGLLRLYAAQIPSEPRPLLAGDHTAWPRLTAPTLRDRTIEHQPTRISGQLPITIGQGYSTLAWLPASTVKTSWALPLLHERIASSESPIGKAVAQLRQVTAQLPTRPVSLWDAEYGTAPFVNASADIPADKLFRLRPNLCLRGAPPPYSGRGRRPQHGAKFKLADASTWGTPEATLEILDEELGPVRLSLWRELHFAKSPVHPMLVLRLERLQARGTRRDPKVLWMAWVGQEPPPLGEWWRLYLRRFAIDHWYRLAKQRLHWVLPRVSTPEQAERWSDLLPLVTWELWLARRLVADKPHPWQKRQALLTPGRVAQGIGGVLAVIGTPAQAPKPRGKAPGWPRGRPRKHRERLEVVRKRPNAKKRVA